MKRILVVTITTALSTLWQGCGSEEEAAPFDCSKNPVTLSIVSIGDSNCGEQNGTIEVSATGGSGTYQYQLGDAGAQASAVFNNVGAGVYEITAIDGNDCSATIEASVRNMNGMNIAFQVSGAGCKGADGTLTVNATDGAEPYQFKIDNGSFGAENTFTQLSSGEHTLVVSDASGCKISQQVRISSGVSFSNTISSIISTNCAVSGCHSGSQAPDFRSFSNIQNNAAQIKTLTGNRTMPQEGSLTQTEIDLIACWVDDGALQN